MKLAVGFITYNDLTDKYLPFFLPSLAAALAAAFPDENDYRILAFDNSESESNANRGYILQNYSDIEFLSAGGNIGFSRAYNRIIAKAAEAGAKYFLMLNPDILLEKDAVAGLIAALDDNVGLGSAAPCLLRWDFAANRRTDIIDSLGLSLKSGLRFIDLRQGKKMSDALPNFLNIIGPSGAAGLFRLSALEKIKENGKYFDERMFMYKEDCDLAYRLFLAGYKSACILPARMYHDRTASAPGSGMMSRLRARKFKGRQIKKWSFANQQLIYQKYWTLQNRQNKFIIIFDQIKVLFFILLFERYLLPEYGRFWQLGKTAKSPNK